jgi:hypothetical protein
MDYILVLRGGWTAPDNFEEWLEMVFNYSRDENGKIIGYTEIEKGVFKDV